MAEACSGANDGPWRQSDVLQKPRVQLLDGLNRTKKLPTSVPTTPPQSSKVSCAACRAKPGGELLGTPSLLAQTSDGINQLTFYGSGDFRGYTNADVRGYDTTNANVG